MSWTIRFFNDMQQQVNLQQQHSVLTRDRLDQVQSRKVRELEPIVYLAPAAPIDRLQRQSIVYLAPAAPPGASFSPTTSTLLSQLSPPRTTEYRPSHLHVPSTMNLISYEPG